MKPVPFSFLVLLTSALALSAAHQHTFPPGIQSLDVCADGDTLHLLVADHDGHGKFPLYHRVSSDAGRTWTSSTRVDEGSAPAKSPHRGMDAQIAAHGGNLVAVWMTAGTGFMGGGPMVTALSADGGRTWTPGPNPADDGLSTGHAFVDVAATADGVFHLVWLDSRDGKQGLRHTRSAHGGRVWSRNVTLKANTCECCWNTLAPGREALQVLFRDKAPRDMAVLKVPAGNASVGAATVLGAFGWEFEGCPHVGGGLAAGFREGKEEWHAVVWTGAAGHSGIHHLVRRGAGNWSAPQRLGHPDARRADLAVAGARLVIAWDQVGDGESSVAAITSTDAGRTWTPAVRLSTPGRLAAYPRAVTTSRGLRVFWTEGAPGQSAEWRMHEVP